MKVYPIFWRHPIRRFLEPVGLLWLFYWLFPQFNAKSKPPPSEINSEDDTGSDYIDPSSAKYTAYRDAGMNNSKSEWIFSLVKFGSYLSNTYFDNSSIHFTPPLLVRFILQTKVHFYSFLWPAIQYLNVFLFFIFLSEVFDHLNIQLLTYLQTRLRHSRL